jgi:hypothetical protein
MPDYFSPVLMKRLSTLQLNLLLHVLCEDSLSAQLLQLFCSHLNNWMKSVVDQDRWSQMTQAELGENLVRAIRQLPHAAGFLKFDPNDKYATDPAARVRELLKMWPPEIKMEQLVLETNHEAMTRELLA